MFSSGARLNAGMNVAELIKQLSQMDQDAEVIFDNGLDYFTVAEVNDVYLANAKNQEVELKGEKIYCSVS